MLNNTELDLQCDVENKSSLVHNIKNLQNLRWICSKSTEYNSTAHSDASFCDRIKSLLPFGNFFFESTQNIKVEHRGVLGELMKKL